MSHAVVVCFQAVRDCGTAGRYMLTEGVYSFEADPFVDHAIAYNCLLGARDAKSREEAWRHEATVQKCGGGSLCETEFLVHMRNDIK